MKEIEKVPIKAFISVRPSKNSCIDFTSDKIKIINDNNRVIEYSVDKVFGPEATQKNVYNNVKDIILKLKEGYNSTIFCYGNTGAGKTYTMIGNDKRPGLVYNLVKDILKESTFKISYFEIYNEKIYDLLEPKELVLREFNNKIIVQNITEEQIDKFELFTSIFLRGNKNRTTGETKLNKNSSRSQSILRLTVGPAKLYLIDLAGSENNKLTGNEGIRLAESSNINKSLFVLGNVVNSILKKEKRIPYRDSKLTRLLQDSIGGNSICYIIANVIDDSTFVHDTLNTLKFVSKSKKIINLGLNLSKSEENVLRTRIPFSNKTNHLKFGSKRLPDKQVGNLETKVSKIDHRVKPLDVKVDKNYNKANKEQRVIKIPKRKKRSDNDSTFTLRSSIYDKPDLILSPNTMEKSYKAFLKRAQEYEESGMIKEALDDYKTIKKFCDNTCIQSRIEILSKMIKDRKNNVQKMTYGEILDILNSGKFVAIKTLSCIGDKRAQAIVDFISGGNFFESLDDLKLLFSEKIVNSIMSSVE